METKKSVINIKAVLKPMIKEAIREIIFEEGVLSKIITEVAIGLNGTLLTEQRQPYQKPTVNLKENSRLKPSAEEEEMALLRAEQKRELDEERKLKAQKMMEKTGMSKVFDNLQREPPRQEPIPVKKPQQILETKEEIPLTVEEKQILLEEERKRKAEEREASKYGASGGMALKGIDPSDPGINISGILGLVGGPETWRRRLGK
jgi:hypothetical protein